MTLARELVKTLRSACARPLPENVALAARLHLLDACGVGLASAGSPVGAAYRGLALEVAKGGAATVFGQASGATSADAALINGGLIHSLEFDDTHTASIAHGSAVIAAAALAVGEAQGSSGAALLGGLCEGLGSPHTLRPRLAARLPRPRIPEHLGRGHAGGGAGCVGAIRID